MVDIKDRDAMVANLLININSLFRMIVCLNENLGECLKKASAKNLSEDEKKDMKLNIKDKYGTYLKQMASEVLEGNTSLFEEIRQFEVVKKNRKDFLQDSRYDEGLVLFEKYVQLFPNFMKKIDPGYLVEVSLLVFNALNQEHFISDSKFLKEYNQFLKEYDPKGNFFYLSNKLKKHEKEALSFFNEFVEWEHSLPLRMS